MENFKPIFRFAVMSDIHYQNEHTIQRDYFEKGVKDAYAYGKNHLLYQQLDALFIVGDFTNSGSEREFEAFKTSMDKVLQPETELTISIAGHEFQHEGEPATIERLSRFFGMEPDVHKKLGDFHFISISTTYGDEFNDEKRQFAYDALFKAAKENPKKPIFFFQHPHLRGTVYGSLGWGKPGLERVLMNFPQIIDFSGHSHAPNNHPRNIHQRHFTSVGIGNMFYFDMDEFDKVYGEVPPSQQPTPDRPHDAAQFLIVEVDAGGAVLIKPYDIISSSFFHSGWHIPAPWNPQTFTYTDARYLNAAKPYFKPDAEVVIDELTADKIAFTFDQAVIDEYQVDAYDITIKRVSDDVIVRKISIWSEYYFMDMSERLSQVIDKLDSHTAYELSIKAHGFFRTTSTDGLILPFTTPEAT